MNLRTAARSTLFFLLGLAVMAPATAADKTSRSHPPAPEFTRTDADSWLNGGPVTLASLRGKVVLVDFWTFGCINCQRSIPWLHAVEKKYAARGLRVVGVHTPEFAHERSRDAVAAKVREFGITHPVMLDNDYAYWNAMGNRFWPAFYIIDRKGLVRGYYPGEVHTGTPRAATIEQLLETLLGSGD